MIVKVDDLTFGWGADARSLPENPDAYGAYTMSPETEKALARQIELAGWRPSWRREPTERVVYRISDGGGASWRQAVTTPSMKGQTLQVVEVP